MIPPSRVFIPLSLRHLTEADGCFVFSPPVTESIQIDQIVFGWVDEGDTGLVLSCLLMLTLTLHRLCVGAGQAERERRERELQL